MKNKTRLNQVLKIVKTSETPVDVNHIAKKLNVHWITAYKLVMEHILNDLKNNHLDTFHNLSIIPIITTKGWIFTTKKEDYNLTHRNV